MASARAPLFTADPPRNMLRESFVATSQRYQLFPDVGKSGLFSQFFEAPGLRAAMLRVRFFAVYFSSAGHYPHPLGRSSTAVTRDYSPRSLLGRWGVL